MASGSNRAYRHLYMNDAEILKLYFVLNRMCNLFLMSEVFEFFSSKYTHFKKLLFIQYY